MFTLLALSWNGLLFKDGFASLTRTPLIRPGTWIRLLCPCYRSATYHNVDSHMSPSQIFISSNEKTKTKLWIWILCCWYPDTSHISSTSFGRPQNTTQRIFSPREQHSPLCNPLTDFFAKKIVELEGSPSPHDRKSANFIWEKITQKGLKLCIQVTSAPLRPKNGLKGPKNYKTCLEIEFLDNFLQQKCRGNLLNIILRPFLCQPNIATSRRFLPN